MSVILTSATERINDTGDCAMLAAGQQENLLDIPECIVHVGTSKAQERIGSSVSSVKELQALLTARNKWVESHYV